MPATSTTRASSRAFKTLADDTRLRILRHLAGGECCVCELTAELGVAQPLLSFHLRILKDAGFVTDRREGRWIYYALDAGALRAVGESVVALAESETPPRRGRRCH